MDTAWVIIGAVDCGGGDGGVVVRVHSAILE